MDTEKIKQAIKEHIHELTGISTEKIDDSDRLMEDLGVDSIVIVQLFVSCQEEFGVDISDELDLSESPDIEKIARIINEKMKKGDETDEDRN